MTGTLGDACARVLGAARRAPSVVALAGYSAMFAILTWPMVTRIGSTTDGRPRDGWSLIWQTRYRERHGLNYSSSRHLDLVPSSTDRRPLAVGITPPDLIGPPAGDPQTCRAKPPVTCLKGEPMRIAVMLDRLEVGGVEKVAIQQVLALRELGHDARLVVLKKRGAGLSAFAEELAEVPVDVLETRLPPLLRASRAVPGFPFLETFHFTFPLMAHRLVRRDEYDVILCHSSYTCLTAFAVQRTRGIPVAAVIWDPTLHVITSSAYADRVLGRVSAALAPLARRFDRWLVRRARLVVLGSLAYRDYVEELGAQRILVLHPGAVPTERIRPASERQPEMLAVTAWKHGKRPERLLPLLEPNPDLRLVLAGAWLDADLREAFEAEVERRGLGNRVEITGEITEQALAERYATAQFVVQAWPSPGFGLSPLEAGAQGTTFVIPQGQGSAELFRDGIDGLIYDPADEGALATAVDRMTAHPEATLAMGRSAHERVCRRASWRARAAELVTELERIVPAS